MFKKYHCNFVLFVFLSASSMVLQGSYKNFRTQKDLKVVTEKTLAEKEKLLAINQVVYVARALAYNGEHLIKKALYNNHHEELAKVLRPSQVNMVLSRDAQTQGGETLLLYACRAKNDCSVSVLPDYQTVRVLLDKNANPFVSDMLGNTPLMLAAQAGRNKASYDVSILLAAMLLEYVNKRDKNLVSYYIKLKNQDGESALSIARNKGNKELCTYLLQLY